MRFKKYKPKKKCKVKPHIIISVCVNCHAGGQNAPEVSIKSLFMSVIILIFVRVNFVPEGSRGVAKRLKQVYGCLWASFEPDHFACQNWNPHPPSADCLSCSDTFPVFVPSSWQTVAPPNVEHIGSTHINLGGIFWEQSRGFSQSSQSKCKLPLLSVR